MATQYWQVLNLDKRETLGQDPWGEMRDILESAAPAGLIYQLIKPGANSIDDNHPTPSSYKQRNNVDGLGAWSTDRIVIISDYAVAYPDGMLTLAEMDEIEDMYLDDDDDDDEKEVNREEHEDNGNGRRYEEDDPAPTLYSFAEEWYGAVPVTFLTRNDVEQVHGLEKQQEQGRRRLHLRNLTKKEYVRSDVIGRICPERIVDKTGEEGSKPIAPGLGHALVVLACWTTEVDKFGAGAEVGKGTWAGDRIEVKVVKEANKKGKEEEEEEEWQDVSEQVAIVLHSVWKLHAF